MRSRPKTYTFHGMHTCGHQVRLTVGNKMTKRDLNAMGQRSEQRPCDTCRTDQYSCRCDKCSEASA